MRKDIFREHILTKNRILYETKKQRRILWFYSQGQDSYKAKKTKLGKEIQFFRGLPKFEDDLRKIDPKYNNIQHRILASVFERILTQADHPMCLWLIIVHIRRTKETRYVANH